MGVASDFHKQTTRSGKLTASLSLVVLLGVTFVLLALPTSQDRPGFDDKLSFATLPAYATARINDLLFKQHSSASVCDPYSRSGYLSLDWDKQITTWRQTDPLQPPCDDAIDYVQLMKTTFSEESELNDTQRVENLQHLETLRNKTILLIGDSVDRNAMHHFTSIVGGRFWQSDYFEPKKYDGIQLSGPSEGWHPNNVPHIYHHEELDFMMYNGFMYGLDDVDEFSQAVDWHAPGLAEDRVDQLFLPFTTALERPPDIIQIQSGLWDLAFWGRIDTRNQVKTDHELTQERMEWWRQRFASFVGSVRRAWPETPIWIRITHRVGKIPDYASRVFSFALPHSKEIKFSNLCVGQMTTAEA